MNGNLALAAAFGFAEHAERNFVGGTWKFTREGYGFDIYDPADSSVIAAIPLSTHRDIGEALAAGRDALPCWRDMPHARRRAILAEALAHMEAEQLETASLIARDTGLPLHAARADLEAAIATARAAVLAAQPEARAGTIGQILSWSNPLVHCLHTLAADLASGHVAILHPSIRAPLTLVRLAEALDSAGLPGGVFNLVQGAGTDAGAALARSPELVRLDFQGSRKTARMLALAAARNGVPMRSFLREVREIALDETADIDAAAARVVDITACHAARPGHGGLAVRLSAGQVSAFADRIERAFERLRYADTDAGARNISPLIAGKFRDAAEDFAEAAVAHGARLLAEAPAPDARTYRMGWFAPPRALLDAEDIVALDPDMAIGPLVILKPDTRG